MSYDLTLTFEARLGQGRGVGLAALGWGELRQRESASPKNHHQAHDHDGRGTEDEAQEARRRRVPTRRVLQMLGATTRPTGPRWPCRPNNCMRNAPTVQPRSEAPTQKPLPD